MRRPTRRQDNVVYEHKGRRIAVGEVSHRGQVAYTFQCAWCKHKPLYGRKFRKHLVVKHKIKDRKAKQIVQTAALEHKRWRTGGIT